MTAVGALVVLLAACGGGSSSHASGKSGSGSKTAQKAVGIKPMRIFAGPSGLTSIGPPQPNGTMWILAKSKTAANIRPLDLASGKASGIVPVSSSATALTELSTATVVVGTGTTTTGSLELRNGTSGAIENVIPMSEPVRSLAPGANGTTVYALQSTRKASSVAIVDTQKNAVTSTVPVSTNTIAIGASVDGTEVFGVQTNGMVREYAVAGGQPVAQFKVGSAAVQVAVSPDGSRLYVLKTTPGSSNVTEVNTSTEQQLKALPAPRHAVALSMTPDGATLYVAVGTSGIGNIQAYSLAHGG